MFKRTSISFICILLSFGYVAAQPYTEEKNDSISFYHNIYEFSEKKNFSKLLYRAIFRKPSSLKKSVPKKTVEVNQNKSSEGKIIRNIFIVNNAPFDIDKDSLRFFSGDNLERIGNTMHINTLPFIIQNLLLFKKNDEFDLLKVQESERLIRSQRYIEKASVRAIEFDAKNDSVDVLVVVQDAFSIYPEAQLSSSRFGLGLKEINFLGLGHRAHVEYSWNYSGGIHDYQYDYSAPNLMNTYINTNLMYKNSHADSSKIKKISIDRPFYSSLTKWAGGVEIAQQSYNQSINVMNTSDFVSQYLKYNTHDYWLAYALKARSRTTRSRSRSVILTSRYYNIDYLKAPDIKYDPTHVYSKENLLLFGAAFSERKYVKDMYLFKYGFVEDVPVGQSYYLMGGVENKNDRNRFYMAFKSAWGRYLKPGYLSVAIEYGSFFDNFKIKEGVITTEINYFTPLFEVGKWKFRQFIKQQTLVGIKRLETDRLSLDDYFGINSFDSETINGTRKFIFNLQTQTFAPWNLWGFKIGPYFTYSMGMLGDDKYGFTRSKVYSLYGLGFLIRNDNLVFNSFELSISFYPHIPDDGHNIFKFNTYESSDFGLRDFDIRKPEKVMYK